MKAYKFSDEKSAVKQHSHVHLKGRDYHSAAEKRVVTKPEGARSGHKESKRDK